MLDINAMRRIEINSSKDERFEKFQMLYGSSFPIFEQRTKSQQEYAFGCSQYHLSEYLDGDTFVGFIAYWEFDSQIYIEHLAVDTTLRGKGYGSQMLNSFIASTSKTIILEIDPVVDDISRARLSFYERCGFRQNGYQHRHPAYREGFLPHPLVVLSSGRQITPDEYDEFFQNLKEIVMKDLSPGAEASSFHPKD